METRREIEMRFQVRLFWREKKVLDGIMTAPMCYHILQFFMVDQFLGGSAAIRGDVQLPTFANLLSARKGEHWEGEAEDGPETGKARFSVEVLR